MPKAKKKTKKEAFELFEKIIQASVNGNPKPKEKKKKK
jgi:hypothetical protein